MTGDATWQYMTGQMHPGTAALLDAFQAESDAVALTATDLRYGPHPREVFDLLQAPTPFRATLAYFHAGYWQSRDKALFRFIAPALAARGFDVALVNYPLSPEASIATLLDSARAALPAILAEAARRNRGGTALVAAGHSAGAHIATELALSGGPVSAVVGLSGVYDLVPLLDTPLNGKLQLDAASAHAASPLPRVRPGLPPALFAVGAQETPAFQAQNAAMHAAWAGAGNAGQAMVVPDADHFSLLRALAPGGALLDAVCRVGLGEA